MGDKTNIAWANATWNPIVGCSRVSAGCEHCYAEKMAHRLAHMPKTAARYEGLTVKGPKGVRWTGKVRLVPEVLDQPLRWRKPRRIFVNSMSDLFHEDVPDEYIDRVFAVMALAPQHTFQVLTKRPERMRERLSDGYLPGRIWDAHIKAGGFAPREPVTWTLPNVWLGVSAENQATADERIPLLLETPAAVRFVSAEPLLGSLNICAVPDKACRPAMFHPRYSPLGDIDWVIVGGESGFGARSCDVDWIRSIKEQCAAAGVACFIKQLGAKPFEGHAEFDHCCDEAHKHPGQHPLGYVGPDGIERPLKHSKGGDPEEWPKDLRIREFPDV